ncbi:uncharacterized protein LOC110452089 [Mizuhopecten yessoensis]|uniref:Myosin-M heavy chain n=1 Tax=Mizuhopecten yessoensis TaxID=6573 RepID=A0A210QKE7_MIZYE|nr:uncharacterized protein LOC110452089 [Mizuhopecten yessoensis]XP_021356055.1 uncharacterized protein LOC110452089 [Mizuhopecten yessoensis]XP_021356056.1 uncharacterized protein LOC110452089 [Mizuhopecten yessoensis]XP_021356057.1 uncharacterized protein LOC110452089 [Mizuhopecten yessoensis]XP_021356059.1 uncharacterized protein LOC110452089 [Mizuhopecten yessoensis]OWF49218.1 Myosin-M heavy chain [Mizuhopecten yessoensis]
MTSRVGGEEKCVNQIHNQDDPKGQGHINISKVTDSTVQGQECPVIRDGAKVDSGGVISIKHRPPRGRCRKSMTQERGDSLIEMHDRNGKPSNLGQQCEDKENMGDSEDQEDHDMMDNLPLLASTAQAVDNVRSDTPIVQGVFSRKIVAKASKNVRQLKHLNDSELSNGDDMSEKGRVHRTNSRKNSLSRVPVSSRFDVLLSNNLFQKYLGQDQEDILDRIYKNRGGVFSGGMRKAYSNIDLTSIDLSQTFENPLSNNGKSASFSTADKRNENRGSHGNDQGHGKDQGQQRRRRVSISSGQEVQGIVDELSGTKKEVTINGQRTVTGISSRGKRQKFNVPSFSEFRKQRQMRIASGHQYAKEAKCLLNNNQSAVHLPEVTSRSLAEASVLVTAISDEKSDSNDQLQSINEDEHKLSGNTGEPPKSLSQEMQVFQSNEQVDSCAVENGNSVLKKEDLIPEQIELRETNSALGPGETGEIPSLDVRDSGEVTSDLSDSGIPLDRPDSEEINSVTSFSDEGKSEGKITCDSLPSEEGGIENVSSQNNSGDVTCVSVSRAEKENESVTSRHHSGEVTCVSLPKEEKGTESVSSRHNSGEVTCVSHPGEKEGTQSASSRHDSGEVISASIPREGGGNPSESSRHNSGEITSAIPTETVSDSHIPKEVVLALMGSSMETQMSDEVFDEDEDNSDLLSSKKPPIDICLQGNDSEECDLVRHDLDLGESDTLVLEDLDVPTTKHMCNISSYDEPCMSSPSSSTKDTCGTFTFNSFEHETSEVKNNFITLEIPSESNTDDVDLSDTGPACDRDCGLLPEIKNYDVVGSETLNSETHVAETTVTETLGMPETQNSLDNCPGGQDGNEASVIQGITDQFDKPQSILDVSEGQNPDKEENISCKPPSPEKPKVLPRIPKRQTKPDIAPRPVPRSRPINDPSRSQVVQTGIRPRKRKLPTRPPRVSRTKSDFDLKSTLKESTSVLMMSRSLDNEQPLLEQEVKPSSPKRNDSSDPPTPPLPSNPPPTFLIPSLPDSEPPTLCSQSDDYNDVAKSPTPQGQIGTSSVPFSPKSLNETGPIHVLNLSNSDNNSPSDDGTFYFPENPFFSDTPSPFNFSSMTSPDQHVGPIFVFPEPLLNSPLSDQEETATQGSGNPSDQSFMSTSESVTSDTSNKPLSWLPTSIDNIYRSCDNVQQSESEIDLTDPDSATTLDSTKNLNVYRSSSDVSHSTPEALQKRRERKERPYKSDPFTGGMRPPGQFIRRQRGLPSDDGFTDDWIDEMDESEAVTLAETEAERDRKRRVRLSVVSDASTDSGVIGQEGSQEVPPSPTGSSGSYGFVTKMGDNSGLSLMEPNRDEENAESVIAVANKEAKKTERKDIIIEIRDTEKSYGRDLHILKDHFYKPMKTNGLLSSEQVEAIFLNLEQLMNANAQFTARLEAALQDAINNDDHDFTEVSIGSLFLKSTDLMMAFESYCVNQSHAGNLLETLEKEKELLRIFLQASQDDNVALRRMPLKSFLILPVQRIMRYPLLLERLHKSTSSETPDKAAIVGAKAKLEEILGHINSKTQKSSGSMKMKKKVADLLLQRQAPSMEKAELNRAAIDILGWNKKDVCDITTCRLQVAMATDHNWATKRLKLKFTTVQGILLTLGQGEMHRSEEEGLLFPHKSSVIQAAVVILKEKNNKYQTVREPFMLNRCIVNHDPDTDDVFEVLENNKEPFVFKGEDKEVKLWLKNMKQQTIDLGTWRKRRNALPNIMIKHLV